MKRLVDGVLVDLTPEEVTKRQTRTDAWEAAQPERDMADLRVQRNSLLVESDIIVLPDRWDIMNDEVKANWTTYRQELRDLPATTDDPVNPTWPTPPG